MMHPVIPVLRQVIGDAENENTPEERDPAKDIVLVRKQNGKHLQAEPGKERSKDQLWDREASQIERLFIAVPFATVEPERKLNYPKNDNEGHEPVTMSVVGRSVAHA